MASAVSQYVLLNVIASPLEGTRSTQVPTYIDNNLRERATGSNRSHKQKSGEEYASKRLEIPLLLLCTSTLIDLVLVLVLFLVRMCEPPSPAPTARASGVVDVICSRTVQDLVTRGGRGHDKMAELIGPGKGGWELSLK